MSLGRALAELIDEEFRADLPGFPDTHDWWRAVCGADVAAHVKPVSFDAVTGELEVCADSTAWAVNMRLLAPALTTRLNEKLDDIRIRTLKILGPAPRDAVERQWFRARPAQERRMNEGAPQPATGRPRSDAVLARARARARAGIVDAEDSPR